MIIRHANKQDSEQLHKIKPFLTEEVLNKRLTEQAEGKAEFMVAEENKKILGFVFLKYYGKPTHPNYPDLEDLFVTESKRGLGIGTALINFCEKLAKKHKYTKIGLAVNPDMNDSVKKLYEKLGYKHNGNKSYVDGIYNGVEDWCIDLEKEL